MAEIPRIGVVRGTDARLWHPWLSINRPPFALRSQIQRAGWFN